MANPPTLQDLQNQLDICAADVASAQAMLSEIIGEQPSQDGATIPPSASLIDNQLNVWTVSSGSQVVMNGATDHSTNGVQLLLWFTGVIYQEAHSLWWGWIGNAWVQQAGDPRKTAPTAPPQAVAAGFTKLAFADDFLMMPDIGYGTNGHKWNAGLWYEPVPSASCFSWDGKTVLTITSPPGSGQINLCTLSHDTTTGQSFQTGYAEARVLCSNWSAFWFLSTAHAQGKPGLCSEIDVVETDSGKPTTIWQTLHSNTGGGGGVPDTWTQGAGDGNLNPQTPGGTILGQWHIFGVLWTASEIVFYCDNQKLASMPTYSSTNQPNFLIFSANPGGIVGGPTTPPVITEVDWVNFWATP